jgi:hypothetical protein
MDINEYMQQSLQLQQAILDELKKLNGGVSLRTSGSAAKPETATVQTVEGKATEVATQQAADPANGSSKQAKAHSKDDAPAPDEAKAPTADDVRAALMAIGKREGSNAAVALLEKYGATSVSVLDPANYAALIADSKA